MARTAPTDLHRGPAPAGGTLVIRLRDAIRGEIEKGRYRPGDRLPSEAQMTQEFGVSRTVVREAVAALRSEGLVEARQGAGVFVLDPPPAAEAPFRNLDLDRVSSLVEMLELRTAVEGDAAGLAALRRSPAQEERIVECHRDLMRRARAGEPTADADFALHLAIADASNNPRFRDFLAFMGSNVIPRRAVVEGDDSPVPADYHALLNDEHEAIVAAILDGDEDRARDAMRRHLKNSQARYRAVLRARRG
ncbi:FadR/GntR family transcriptional regulator [Frigidibacter oleivorans]|uniref:FadR/GntR family transcriptional regulator n=1 Tax=Frigidibacter oleivorans TaxID=2487129 RepID=UPI000F8D4C65|nr:FadR/GntR family transcriptional regulator [Frigidibacter oleivorans]